MDFNLIIPAFIAGAFTFLAPCTLPLVPAYLVSISGISFNQAKNLRATKSIRTKVFLNGLFFVIGFSLVFITFGTIAGILGSSIVPLRLWLARLGGALVIIFGLLMLGVLKFKMLAKERGFKLPKYISPGHPSSALIIGGAFALGWTPCVGPILGSILFIATQSATALQGAILLGVFCLGLGLPFLILALFIDRSSVLISKLTRVLQKSRVIILGIAGFLSGFLFNLALLAIANFLGSTGQTLTNISLALLNNAPFLLPILIGALLGALAYRKEDIDIISLSGGIFFIPIGVLLFTNNFGIVIQYGYKFFEFINYQGILNLL